MCAGLEGSQNTSWAELSPSEKVSMAYAFLHEEDSLLALKFLARTMASFGGSKGTSSACLNPDHCGRRTALKIIGQDLVWTAVLYVIGSAVQNCVGR